MDDMAWNRRQLLFIFGPVMGLISLWIASIAVAVGIAFMQIGVGYSAMIDCGLGLVCVGLTLEFARSFKADRRIARGKSGQCFFCPHEISAIDERCPTCNRVLFVPTNGEKADVVKANQFVERRWWKQAWRRASADRGIGFSRKKG